MRMNELHLKCDCYEVLILILYNPKKGNPSLEYAHEWKGRIAPTFDQTSRLEAVNTPTPGYSSNVLS